MNVHAVNATAANPANTPMIFMSPIVAAVNCFHNESRVRS